MMSSPAKESKSVGPPRFSRTSWPPFGSFESAKFSAEPSTSALSPVEEAVAEAGFEPVIAEAADQRDQRAI